MMDYQAQLNRKKKKIPHQTCKPGQPGLP
jgi:hypothetical protein